MSGCFVEVELFRSLCYNGSVKRTYCLVYAFSLLGLATFATALLVKADSSFCAPAADAALTAGRAPGVKGPLSWVRAAIISESPCVEALKVAFSSQYKC